MDTVLSDLLLINNRERAATWYQKNVTEVREEGSGCILMFNDTWQLDTVANVVTNTNPSCQISFTIPTHIVAWVTRNNR